jgi:DNA-nicking Smr family endonuclease
MSQIRSIDLHQHTVREALRDFTAFYNRCLREGYRGRIEAIHGYGSAGVGGAIKPALREFLEARASCFERIVFTPGNPGVTAVYPKCQIGDDPPQADGKTRRITPLPGTRGIGRQR